MNTNILHDLVTLVKVFDSNFVTDEDCEQLNCLNLDQEHGVRGAVHQLLLPEFFGYTEAAQARLLNSLRKVLADPAENFDDLFERVDFAFDLPEENRRDFMRALLRSLEYSERL